VGSDVTAEGPKPAKPQRRQPAPPSVLRNSPPKLKDARTSAGRPEVAWSAQAVWLLVAWGYWIDRHRAGR